MNNWHMVPGRVGWSVRRTRSERAVRTGLSEKQAWESCRALAARDRSVAYRHDRDGRIVERVSHEGSSDRW